MKTVLLARHADIDVPPGGPDPLLNAKGKQRAQDLARALEAADIRQVFVSSAKRTQLTAKPLLEQLAGVSAEIEDDVGSLAAKILAAAGNVLVVGHSNTVPNIVAALGAKQPAAICDPEYDNLYIVTIPAQGAAGVIHARYGAPSRVEAACGGMK
jgi:broad specificity phosphatase PhoE